MQSFCLGARWSKDSKATRTSTSRIVHDAIIMIVLEAVDNLRIASGSG